MTSLRLNLLSKNGLGLVASEQVVCESKERQLCVEIECNVTVVQEIDLSSTTNTYTNDLFTVEKSPYRQILYSRQDFFIVEKSPYRQTLYSRKDLFIVEKSPDQSLVSRQDLFIVEKSPTPYSRQDLFIVEKSPDPLSRQDLFIVEKSPDPLF
ncbi:hypothetical protein DPMN_077801 [Dreissena polymorpha]|uniref:Uncharacterized protein n=1 Tax=Dreissena polymorpha TaxID=45954 RepID=A0A9D3YQ10_DREPO|nr:hypothetical protein DPMN_077801 [Dreissena polymorpha]